MYSTQYRFRVTAPDGRVYNVNAPLGATQQQAVAYVQRQLASNPPAPRPSSPGISASANAAAGPLPPSRQGLGHIGPVSGRALPSAPPIRRVPSAAGYGNQVVDNFTGGWADEIAGVGGVIGNGLRTLFRGDEFRPAEAFTRVRRRTEDEQNQWRRDHPVQRVAGAAQGLATAALLPAARVVRGGGLGGRMLNAGATGALYGTISGAGHGEGTDRLGNALEGGTFGALLGPVAEAGIRVASPVVRRARDVISPYLPRMLGGGTDAARTAAEREVGSALAAGGHSPDAAAAELARRRAMGVPAVAADLGDQARQLAGHASRGVGPGQAAVREGIRRRQSAMAPRMRQHIDETLGTTVNPHAQSQALTAQAREASRDLYRAAYESPVVVTPALREFMDSPIGPQALEAGADQIRMTPSSARNPGSEQPFVPGTAFDPTLGPHGDYRSAQVPVLEAWDGAKRHLDDIEFATNSPFQTTPQHMSSDTRALDLRRRELLSELDAQVPAYGQARAAFAGPTMDRQAFETGMESLPGTARNTANDALSQMGGMSDSQLAQFRLGDRTQLADQVHGSRTAISRWGDATGPIIGNDGRAALVRAIHGDQAAEALTQRLEAEQQAHLTFQATHGNSGTSGRPAIDQAMGAANGIQAAVQLAHGRPLAAAWTILSDAGHGRFGRFGRQLREEMGRMLTDSGAQSTDDAMRLIADRMQRDAAFAHRLNRAASAMTRAGTIGTVGNSGDDSGMYGDAEDFDPVYSGDPYADLAPQ